MPGSQSSEHGRGGIREQVARLANIFPDRFAVPMLRSLGFERPELSRYYVEVDRAIQTYLQQKLTKLGYSDITLESLGRDSDSSRDGRFAYGYLLSYKGKITNPTQIKDYIYDAQQRLMRIIQSTDVEFDNFPPTDRIYARLKLNNRTYVANSRLEI